MRKIVKNEGPWTVYRIEFSEGRRYIGITVDLKRRLSSHRSPANSNNSVLCRMLSKEPHRVRVLAQGLAHEEASRMERDLARRLRRPINYTYCGAKAIGLRRGYKAVRYRPDWLSDAPCRTCGRRPATDFWRDSTRRNGLSSQCIRCASAERWPPRPGKHHCYVCRELKDVGDFWRNASRRSGVASKCAPCHRIIQRFLRRSANDTAAKRSAAYADALAAIRDGM